MEAETNETERREMGIVVLGAVFVDIKGYPSDITFPAGATPAGWSRCTAA